MIDIHSHIIFDVDDGPRNIEESLRLVQSAAEQGVRIIVATSHRRKGMFETPEKKIKAHFLQLKAEVARLLPKVTLCYGGELYYTKDMIEKLTQKKIPTINGSRYVLLEFSMTTPWKDIQEAVREVQMIGLTPLIAHIERYNALAFEEGRVRELIESGCYTQVNSNHLLKAELIGDAAKEFKKRARYFLERDLIHCVASDMHNLDTRPSYMKEAYELVCREYGLDRAKNLFKKNPLALLKNQYLDT